MTIRAAFEAYRMDVIVFSNQSRKTEENHRIVEKNLVAFFGNISVESLSFPMVREWKLALDRGRSPETVRNYIIKLRVVLAYLQKRGIDVLDPSIIPVPKRTDKVPRFISEQEVSLLIQHSFRLRSKCIISLLYSSGIRVNELIMLDRGQIQNKSFTVVGKGGKARLCFIDKRTDGYLKLYLETRKDHHPALFISTQSLRRMTASNVQVTIKAAGVKAGIKKHVTPHTLRHSFATNLLRSNCNMRYVQTLLGHSSLATTQMYTHVVDYDLQKVYSKHHTT